MEAQPTTTNHSYPGLLSYLDHELNFRRLGVLKPRVHGHETGSEIDADDQAFVEGAIKTRAIVDNFLSVPKELEKMLFFGFIVCLDVFLSYFTFLPIRVMWAIWCLVSSFSHWIQMNLLFWIKPKGISDRHHDSHEKAPRIRFLRNTQIIDLLKGVSLAICTYLLFQCDYSMMYHYVRGESPLKLYFVYNVLEVFDRLCCAFGQDIQDLMFFSFTDPGTRYSTRIYTMLVNAIYLFIHAFTKFAQVITLNVALNSTNNSLITLLVSNNFVELKTSVFKRFGKEMFFQISVSDIVERFQISLYCFIICIQNTRAAVFGFDELSSLMMVLLGEVCVDWIKHTFISKFNEISAKTYATFSQLLCEDLCTNRDRDTFVDSENAISRRLGLISAPLVVFALRIFIHALYFLELESTDIRISVWILCGWIALFVLKVILGIGLHLYAAFVINHRQESAMQPGVPQARLRSNSPVPSEMTKHSKTTPLPSSFAARTPKTSADNVLSSPGNRPDNAEPQESALSEGQQTGASPAKSPATHPTLAGLNDHTDFGPACSDSDQQPSPHSDTSSTPTSPSDCSPYPVVSKSTPYKRRPFLRRWTSIFG